ncbi:MAG: ROK family transcriptional regulator [Treponema sp.]|jgi:predicted NBD/HSP70 family sugar kinase|nr:ROK family transcriptional regulator [Treponema sp.]
MKFITTNDDKKQYSHQSIVKESNCKQIFDLIFENEGISRIEISKKTGLSRATVSMLVDELAEAGLINILGEGDSASSGRKPIMLEINKDRVQIITLSMMQSTFRYTLCDLKGGEIDTFLQSVVYKKGCAKKIWNDIQDKSPHLDAEKLQAVCVAIPAKINNAEKIINFSSVLDIQKNCDLLAELKTIQPKLPLLVGNTSSAYAYAEYKYVYNGKIDDMIFFCIGAGVGAGILMNGRVFNGEIGHMTIDPEGPLCSCGKRGCVESLVSKTVLLREFEMIVRKNRDSHLYKLCDGDGTRIHYGNIRVALENKDPRTIEVAGRLAGKIAYCISNVICMFNPEEIVIGCGIEELGQTFLDMIIQKVEIPGSNGVGSVKNMHIRYSRIESNAEAKGLFRYFLDKLFTVVTETENMIYLWN